MAQNTAPDHDFRCTAQYGYSVISEANGILLTFETRHDAVGFAAIWEAEFNDPIEIDAQPHRSKSELVSLKEA